jgi:hypothetical protein
MLPAPRIPRTEDGLLSGLSRRLASVALQREKNHDNKMAEVPQKGWNAALWFRSLLAQTFQPRQGDAGHTLGASESQILGVAATSV